MKKLFTLCLTISIAILANATGNGFKETFVYRYTDDVAGIAQAAYLDYTEYRKIPVDEYANKMKGAWKGRDEVIKTSLQNEDRPVMIVGNANIPEGKRSFLILNVSCEDDGEWELEITIEPAFVLDPEFFGKEIINSFSTTNGWKEIKFDLTKYSGNDVEFQIIQSADEIHKSHAYWSKIKIVSE